MLQYKIARCRLNNGTNGLLIHVPSSSIIGLHIMFRAGRLFCQPKKPETAHFMEHLVLMANKQHPTAASFHRVIEDDGSYMDAYTGDSGLGYIFEIPNLGKKLVARKLEIATKAIASPLFLEDEIDSERQVVGQELAGHLDDPVHALIDEIMVRMGVYGLTIKQRLNQLSNHKRADLVAYHRRTHTLSNCWFIAVGDLRRHRRSLLTCIEESGLSPGRGQLKSRKKKLSLPNDLVVIRKPEASNISFRIGLFSDDDFDLEARIANNFLLSILTSGLDSRLLGAGRQSGLFYSLQSTIWGLLFGRQLWTIGSRVSPDKLVDAVDFIVSETKALIEGKLTEAEVEANKLKLHGRFVKANDDAAGISNIISSAFFERDWVINPKSYEKLILAVDRAAVLAAGKRLIGSPPKWVLGLSGPVTPTHKRRLKPIVSKLWS